MFSLLQPAPTAELDRSDDKVYQSVMGLVKVVVQLKNDVTELQSEQYITLVQVRRDKSVFHSDLNVHELLVTPNTSSLATD